MKIAITSSGENIEDSVDPRFGRCAFFLIFELPDHTPSIITNESGNATHGAGIATAQMISQKNVQAVITGNVGPNAFQTLTGFGLKVFTGASGTVREAVEAYKEGNLADASSPTVGGHHGMGSGVGRGRGGR